MNEMNMLPPMSGHLRPVIPGALELPFGKKTITVTKIATGNPSKHQSWLAAGLELEAVKLNLDEEMPGMPNVSQPDSREHLDLLFSRKYKEAVSKRAAEKAEKAHRRNNNQPTLVRDIQFVATAFPHLSAFIDYWAIKDPKLGRSLLTEFCKMASSAENMRAFAFSTYAIFDGERAYTNLSSISGEIAREPKGYLTDCSNNYETIFIPSPEIQREILDTNKKFTLAQLRRKFRADIIDEKFGFATLDEATSNFPAYDQIEIESDSISKEFIRDIANGKSIEASRHIVISKAIQAYKQAGEPVLVDDASLVLDGCPQLTSALIKFWTKGRGEKDFLSELCQLEPVRRTNTATAICQLAVANGTTPEDVLVFQVEVPCEIADSPRGEYGFGYDKIIIPSPKTQEKIFPSKPLKTQAEIPPEIRSEHFGFREMLVEKLAPYGRVV